MQVWKRHAAGSHVCWRGKGRVVDEEVKRGEKERKKTKIKETKTD